MEVLAGVILMFNILIIRLSYWKDVKLPCYGRMKHNLKMCRLSSKNDDRAEGIVDGDQSRITVKQLDWILFVVFLTFVLFATVTLLIIILS